MARDRRPRTPVTAAPRRTARALQRKGRAPSARRSGARSASVDAPRAAEASGPGARRRARRRRAAGASLRVLLRPSGCAVNSLPQLPRLHAAGVRVGPLVLVRIAGAGVDERRRRPGALVVRLVAYFSWSCPQRFSRRRPSAG